MNILVLGVGGNVSQGIIKAVRMIDGDKHIIGACISEMNAGYFMCDDWEVSPKCDTNEFIDWLIDICQIQSIDLILTGVEEIISAIDLNLQQLNSETKAFFLSPGNRVLGICSDKLKTCSWLKKNNLNFPDFAKENSLSELKALVKRVGFPMIVKPKQGKGSLGVKLLNDEKELLKYVGDQDNIIQECIGNENTEFTVGCYIDKTSKIHMIILRRKLSDGKTVFAEVTNNTSITKECERICKALDTKGSINIQLRLNAEGEPVCFEINSRLSGTTAMRANFGFNDVEALINEYLLNKDISHLNSIQQGIAIRYDDELYSFK